MFRVWLNCYMYWVQCSWYTTRGWQAAESMLMAALHVSWTFSILLLNILTHNWNEDNNYILYSHICTMIAWTMMDIFWVPTNQVSFDNVAWSYYLMWNAILINTGGGSGALTLDRAWTDFIRGLYNLEISGIIIIIIIIMNFYSPVSNTRCHSIGHKMRIARIKIRVDSPGRWERA